MKRRLSPVALGLLQGPGELLPISSSAHARLLGGYDDKALEVALHTGSLVALVANVPVSRLLSNREPRKFARSATFAALTLAPPTAAVLAFEDFIERRLGTPRAMAAGLLLGSALLLAADGAQGTRKAADATPLDALVIGAAQALALWPGTSRSATTLTAAVLRGFAHDEAAALSRRALVPILTAATLKKAPDFRPRHVPASLSAAVSTYAALRTIRPPTRYRAIAVYRTAIAIATLWQDRRR